jgi:DNA topoisomerase VI subunit B
VIQVIVSEYSEEEHNRRFPPHTSPSLTKICRHGITTNSPSPLFQSEEGTLDSINLKPKCSRSTSEKSTHREVMYYDIQCIDNGSGIHPDQVGDLLGRVLSGSKHGIKQTRGKFGLGAKMALIWSKKSSGLPITIRTAYSTSISSKPTTVSTIVLDMDIRKNEPRIISRKDLTMASFLRSTSSSTSPTSIPPHSSSSADSTESDPWCRGLDLTVTIAGSWSTTRSRVLQYFQQLAVITPYAHLSLQFVSSKDSKKNLTAEFIRRSCFSLSLPPSLTPPSPPSPTDPIKCRLLQRRSFLTQEVSTTSHCLISSAPQMAP